ncbi:unnamed protein product, partial [Ectocarpus sp. 6 AP-2014]
VFAALHGLRLGSERGQENASFSFQQVGRSISKHPSAVSHRPYSENMESFTETKALGEEMADDLWGTSHRDFRAVTGGTEASNESDFTPEQLAVMRKRFSVEGMPLPDGVEDVEWQPPVSTGLQHSSAIFNTTSDQEGVLRLSSAGLNVDNCHFRSWQEDNGVAKTFASDTVVKDVDGVKRSVAIDRGFPHLAGRAKTMMPADLRSSHARAESEAIRPVVRPGTRIVSPSMGMPFRRAKTGPVSATEGSSHDRLQFTEEDESGSDESESPVEPGTSKDAVKGVGEGKELSENGRDSAVGETGAEPSDGSSKQTSLMARRPSCTSSNVAGDAPERTDDTKDSPQRDDGPTDGVTTGPSLPSSTDRSKQPCSQTPRRPSRGPASFHARHQPQKRRSLRHKDAIGDVLDLAQKGGGAEEVRQPSPVRRSSGECKTAVVVHESGAVEGAPGVAPRLEKDAAITNSQDGHAVVVGTAGTSDGQNGRGRLKEELEEQQHRVPELSSLTPSTKMGKATKKSWWGGPRTPNRKIRHPCKSPPREPVPEQAKKQPREQPEEPVHESELAAAVSHATSSRAAPDRRSWLSFKWNRRNVSA